VTGPELRKLRDDLGKALGRTLSAADMARLCGLTPANGGDTIRRWEISGPSGPAGELLRILAMACDDYPILDNFNVFDRFNIPEQERPARRQEFRAQMRDEVRRRLGAS
jgi:transcriptional regulator with XRE-family HTH domain